MSEAVRPPARPPLSWLLTLAFLTFIWLEVMLQFVQAMAPRLAAVFTRAPIGPTSPCLSPDCDFSIFWPAGLLARAGNYATVYQPSLFAAFRQHVLWAGTQRLDWIYPPPTLLPAMVISFLPFQLAFLVWTAVLAAAAVAVLRWARLPASVIAVSLVSPAALWNFEMGQVEMFCGACVVAGLAMLEEAPVTAGVLLGMLVFKPQAGLLAPVAALGRRAWLAVAGGLAAAGATIAAAAVMGSGRAWLAYLGPGRAQAAQIMNAARPIGLERGVSVLWMLRGVGVGAGPAAAAQAAVSVLAVALLWHVWRPGKFPRVERVALTVVLSLMAVPYGFVDDMVAYSIALTWLAQRRSWRISMLDAWLWLWPALCPIVFGITGVLWTPVMLALAAWRIGMGENGGAVLKKTAFRYFTPKV